MVRGDLPADFVASVTQLLLERSQSQVLVARNGPEQQLGHSEHGLRTPPGWRPQGSLHRLLDLDCKFCALRFPTGLGSLSHGPASPPTAGPPALIWPLASAGVGFWGTYVTKPPSPTHTPRACLRPGGKADAVLLSFDLCTIPTLHICVYVTIASVGVTSMGFFLTSSF